MDKEEMMAVRQSLYTSLAYLNLALRDATTEGAVVEEKRVLKVIETIEEYLHGD